MPKPQMEFSGTFRSALPQVDRLSPAGYPTPELLQKYRYLSCTFVILTTRATGLPLSRAYCARRPSDDTVERSLTSREISSRLPVVSCQFAKLRRFHDVESWRRGSKRFCFLARPEVCQALLSDNYLLPTGSSRGTHLAT